MVNDPFVDTDPDGTVVIARGQIWFLQVALQTASGSYVAPDADAFTRTDIRAIYDPDGNNVTALWVTNERDVTDVDDTYDAAHATYVGDDASPNNIGLFYQATGRVAQKVKAPSNVEITKGTARRFRIDWAIKKGSLITKTEYFQTDVAASLVTTSSFVTVDEVRAVISTKMTDPQIESVIEHVTKKARGRAMLYGFDWDSMTELDDYLRTIIVEWCCTMVFTYDQSAYRKIEKLKEGGKRVEFSGTSSKDLERQQAEVKADFEEWLKQKTKYRQPKMKVVTHHYLNTSDPFK